MAPLLGDWTASNTGPDAGVDHQGTRQRSILYIDAYDSFSYNVVAMIEEVLGARVTVMMIDAEWPDGNMVEFLHHYDAVVLGPGPGDPNVPEDVGVMADIWNICSSHTLPVLGICLGFQSLCLHHGISIGRLPEPLHGQVHRITTMQRDIFEDLRDLEVTLYHSLYAMFDDREKSTSNSDLDVLAWFFTKPDASSSSTWRIPMAVRHREKPFWGVQFHPESCKSNREACNELLRKWWSMSVKYNKSNNREGYGTLPTDIIRPSSEETSLPDVAYTMVNWCASSSAQCAFRSVSTCQPDAEGICEIFNDPRLPAVLFQSNGKHSVISVPSPGSWRLEYYADEQSLSLQRCPTSSSVRDSSKVANSKVEAVSSVSQLWDILRYLVDLKKVESGHSEVPFWAGFLGYFSYELGLACLAQPKHENGIFQKEYSSQASAGAEDPPDVSLIWTERSIVVDNENGRITVQSTREEDNLPAGWLDYAVNTLKSLFGVDVPPSSENSVADEEFLDSILARGVVHFPTEESYRSQVEACKNELRAGESYELCLTCETSITLPSPDTATGRMSFPWKLYKRLRKYNPAAFSAFARLGKVKIVSSSPECFLNWDRHSTLEMKPMKGTVRKSDSMTMGRAREILGSTKEMAENLMIADLIRHDLYGICGAGNVHVEKLLEVEDHGRVYQMVTHVKGHIDPYRHGYAAKGLPRLQSSNMLGYGLTALQRCLPPGSMTGAPKERSCMHLSSIEGRKRGIYSGVMGFLDLGGGGSFSVLIRSAFNSSDDQADIQKWRIGAGGAVTMLSSAEGEWDEMLTKLRTVCGILMPSHA